eukprot:gb/GECH01012335.1/.p1 GENE.gb/GECH01012335.1/~~gb/GECH01012335.1/.p1  ORF type:complete len:872 (+),score=203.33 gb/GECH01012335.1/:1-2616(+)
MVEQNKEQKGSQNNDQKNDQKKEKKKQQLELSEEDAAKKEELDMLVERVQDSDESITQTALENIAKEIRESTSSMTAVPKPLKFLKEHFSTLEQHYNKVKASDMKKLYADILSMLAMVMAPEGSRRSLKYKLEGNISELGSWGHEYVRSLAGEIGQEYQEKSEKDQPVDDLMELVDQIVPFHINSNAEADACDLLIEVEKLDKILTYCDETNYSRVCEYLLACAYYAPEPEDTQMLKVCYTIFKDQKEYPSALRVALRLNQRKFIEEIFYMCPDEPTKRQMAFMLARQRVYFQDEEDEELKEIMGNNKLTEHFLYLAKDLDSMEPKTPEDIYKSHLTESKSALSGNVDSARQNLASTFVNAFVNAGFGQDKLITEEESDWIYKNKGHGIISAAASMGMIYLWNVDDGLSAIDKYLYANDNNVKAGACLGIGVCNTGIQNDMEPAVGLLREYLEDTPRDVRISSILGLAMACAGSPGEDIQSLLMPLLADSEQNFEITCFSGLALGLVNVGTCDEETAEPLLEALLERDDKTLESPLTRLLILGLGLVYLGKQEYADAIIESAKATLSEKTAKLCELTLLTCAYAGSGDVLKIQRLLAICGEHLEENEDNRHQGIAVLGIAMIAMGEPIGSEMAIRAFDHLLQYGDLVIRRSVPLALGLLNVSNPKLTVMDTLSKLSHDTDSQVAQCAILGLGFLGAGSNHARIGQLLRSLSTYYSKDPNSLFVVRLAQGLLFAGKGLVTMSPIHSDRMLLSPVALAGLLVVLHSSLEIKDTLLGKYAYLLYFLVCSMYPRMLVTVDENLEYVSTPVRVGTAVDTVAQAGRPRRITGFQTHNSPVLLQYEERAELGSEEYIPLSSVLEGVVVLKKNPDFKEE